MKKVARNRKSSYVRLLSIHVEQVLPDRSTSNGHDKKLDTGKHRVNHYAKIINDRKSQQYEIHS